MNILGFDIGGTKVSIVVGNESGEILHKRRVESKTLGGPKEGMRLIMDEARAMLAEADVHLLDIAGIGVSAPGPVDAKNGLLHSLTNLSGWDKLPIAQILADEFGRPAFVNNDANACAMAEWLFGPHKGKDPLIYMTASSGMGAGIIANGRVIQGASDTAGEIGYFVLQRNGLHWRTGINGAFEAYCGGLSLAQTLRQRIEAEGIQTSILKHAGGDAKAIDVRAFREAVREGDPFAVEQWNEFVEYLAQGIGIMLQTINPRVIILGTIAIHSGPLLMDPLRAALPRYAWPQPIAAAEIVPSTLEGRIGDLSAIASALVSLG